MKNILKREILLLLTALVVLLLGGCGNTIAKDSLTRPPEITLTAFLKEAGEITLQAGGYNWNYRVSKEEGTGVIADGASPLDETYPWEVLVVPASASGVEQYRFSFEWIVKELEDKTDEINWPDELLIRSWDEADIGNTEAEELDTAIWTGKDLEAEGFLLDIKPGRVYEIVLTYNQKDYEKDGFYGTASYVFRTATQEPVEE